MWTISATTKVGIGSGREPLERPLARLAGFFLAVFRWRMDLERYDEARGRRRHLVDRAVERVFVVAGWLGGAAQLADELQRRSADFVSGRGRLEVGECFDVPAH